MQYYRISKVKKKPHQVYKLHIKSDNEKFLCGISVTPSFVATTDSIVPESICENCQRIVEGIAPIRNKSFRKVVVEKLTGFIDLTSEDFKSEFSKACVDLTNEYGALGLSCEYDVEQDYNGNISGKVIFHSHRYKNMYMRFTYKPRNKEKLRFEKPLREYLRLEFSEVVSELGE